MEYATPEIEKLMWELFLEYELEIKSETPFDPLMDFISSHPSLKAGESSSLTIKPKVAFIESVNGTDYLQLSYNIFGTKLPNDTNQIIPNIIERGWKIE